MIYFAGGILIYALHLVLKLNLWMCLLLGVYALWLIPQCRNRYRLIKDKQSRFYEVSLYLDTILYAFAKEEKVEQALRDVCHTLPEGPMKSVVQTAHEYMMMTYDEVQVMQEAFAMIEQAYPCKRMEEVHKFMIHVEYYGGEIERPIKLLLEDKSRWEKRMKAEIASRKKQFADILLSVLMSLGICAAIMHLPVLNIDLGQEWLLQIAGGLVVIADSLILYRGLNYLAEEWIAVQLQLEESVSLRKLEDYQRYDKKRQEKLSLVLGLMGGAVSVLFFFQQKEWLVLISLVVTIGLFHQHRLGRGLLRRTLEKEIKYAFPNWLLDLVLLLQSENVHVALRKSMEFAPAILRKRLWQLLEQLELEPEAARPYHEFLKDFEIPEVHSAMGILYSLSIGTSGNADRQIGELVDKNLELLDRMESERLRQKAAGMHLLFLLPVLTASFKLVADMVVLMLRFMEVSML